MKFSLLPLILSAGLAISQASAAPIRVVVVSEHYSSPNGFVRVGHAAAHHNNNVATMNAVNKAYTKPKHGCAGSLRFKAVQLSNWFKHIFGLPKTKTPSDSSLRLAPHLVELPSAIPVELPSAVPVRPLYHHHHGKMQYSAHGHTFVQRLTHALMMLGPWEGRAVSFILGCGIGVLIRMFWVLAVIAIRSIRGKKQPEEFLSDEVIFEEEEHLLPPQYVETIVKEKSDPIPVEPST